MILMNTGIHYMELKEYFARGIIVPVPGGIHYMELKGTWRECRHIMV